MRFVDKFSIRESASLHYKLADSHYFSAVLKQQVGAF